jgi:outer membrane protein assembly factor BamD
MLKKIVITLGVALGLAACDPLDEYRNKSDTYLYNAAIELMEYGRYERAAKIFEEVDLQHPSSPLAAKGLLMAGYCYYIESNPTSRNTNRFPEAIDKFESFMRLHPNHEMTPYAMYMIGMCHFDMLGDEMRDQSSGPKALSAFKSLIDRFPSSAYVRDATTKVQIITTYAAKKNLYIAETLMKEGYYAPAIARLHQAISVTLSPDDSQRAKRMLNVCYKALKLNHLISSNHNVITP